MKQFRIIEETNYKSTRYLIEKKGIFGWNFLTIKDYYIDWYLSFDTLEQAEEYILKQQPTKQRIVKEIIIE